MTTTAEDNHTLDPVNQPAQPAQPSKTTPPTGDMWITYLDQNTGRLTVELSHRDAWSTDHLVTQEPAPGQTLDHTQGQSQDQTPHLPIQDHTINQLVDRLVRSKAETRNIDNPQALEHAKEIAATIFRKNLATLFHNHNMSLPEAAHKAGPSAAQAFDRSYNLARIQLAGIDVDRHPELNSHRFLFEQGTSLPTHEQLADFIIQQFTANTRPTTPEA